MDRDPHSSQSSHLPVCFWALLALTAAIRLIAVTRPLLGNFATKGAVYGMIARNWAAGRASLWYPTLDVIRGGERSLHMVEWPLSAYLTAGLWRVFGGSLDIWGRATSVGFSVGSVALLYLLVRRHHGPTAATAAALALAISPISLIYGQSFMLEASLVFLTVATFYTLERWLDGGATAWLILAGVALTLLLLTKVYMAVIALPLAAWFFCSRRRAEVWAWLAFGVVLVVASLPAAAWYAHAARTALPDGPLAERVYYSVRDSAAVHRPPHPLLTTADFYRQVLDNLAGIVLTPVGFVLAAMGVMNRRWRRYAVWLLACGLLILLLPLKFHEMNYYYLAILPPLCILVGLGWQAIHEGVRPGRAATGALLLLAAAFSLRYSLNPAFVTPEEDRPVVAAARAVRELTEENEPVVTVHGTSIDLLYYCDRTGWALAPETANEEDVLDDCRRQSARYMVVVGHDPPEHLAVVARGEGYCVCRLSTQEP